MFRIRAFAVSVVIGTIGSMYDDDENPVTPPVPLPVTTMGIERDGFRGDFLSVTVGMGNEERVGPVFTGPRCPDTEPDHRKPGLSAARSHNATHSGPITNRTGKRLPGLAPGFCGLTAGPGETIVESSACRAMPDTYSHAATQACEALT